MVLYRNQAVAQRGRLLLALAETVQELFAAAAAAPGGGGGGGVVIRSNRSDLSLSSTTAPLVPFSFTSHKSLYLVVARRSICMQTSALFKSRHNVNRVQFF